MKYPTLDWGTMEAVVNRLGGLEGVQRFLRGEIKVVEAGVKSLLSVIKTVLTPKVAGKKTADCFTDPKRYSYRDRSLDSLLPENQPAQPKSTFAVGRLETPATFKMAVESFLGVIGEIPLLAKTLIERGHTTTLPTIESLIEQQEAGKDVDLRTDGWANFFFVEEKAEKEGEDPGVSVVYVLRDDGRWAVDVYRLDDDGGWGPELHFFFRNKTL